MKILLTSHSPLITGGAEQCLLEYASELVKQGHKCWIAVPAHGEMTHKLKNSPINYKVVPLSWAIKPHDHKGAMIGSGESFLGLFKYAQEIEPDIIIVNTVVVPWGLYVGKALGIPTLALVHEIINDKQQAIAIAPDYKTYVNNLNNNTDYVIYNSQFVKNEFATDLTLPKTSSKILYPVPSIDNKKITQEYKKNVIGDIVTVAVIGSVSPRKNQMEALESARLLKREKVKFRIDIYGDTNDIKYVLKLKRYIKKYGLEKHVRFCGFSDNIYATINEYNIVLSASINEPFGRTILEGQLFGRIVISNNTGGGLELVEDKKNGLVYEQGDPAQLAESIKWVISNKDEALAIGLSAKKEQYKKYIQADIYEPLFEAVSYLKAKKPTSIDMFDPTAGLAMYALHHHRGGGIVRKLYRNRVTRALANRFGFIRKTHHFLFH